MLIEPVLLSIHIDIFGVIDRRHRKTFLDQKSRQNHAHTFVWVYRLEWGEGKKKWSVEEERNQGREGERMMRQVGKRSRMWSNEWKARPALHHFKGTFSAVCVSQPLAPGSHLFLSFPFLSILSFFYLSAFFTLHPSLWEYLFLEFGEKSNYCHSLTYLPLSFTSLSLSFTRQTSSERKLPFLFTSNTFYSLYTIVSLGNYQLGNHLLIQSLFVRYIFE